MEGSATGAESAAMNAGDPPMVAVTLTVPVGPCEKEPGRTLGVCSVWTAALSAVTAACRFVMASVALAVLGAPITRTRPPTTGRRNFAILRPRYLIADPRSRLRQSNVLQNRVPPTVDDIVALGRAECLLRSRRLVIEFYQSLG